MNSACRLLSCVLAFALCGCAQPAGEPAAAVAVETDLYSRVDDPNDPYRASYAEFRARRARDMADPDFPPPLDRYPAFHRTEDLPWGSLKKLFPFAWSALRDAQPQAAEQLTQVVRARMAFDHPDLKIMQLMIGAGGVLPAHADGAPAAFIVVGGEGEIVVEGEAQQVTTGGTVRLAPYAVRRVQASEASALRVLWIRWAPGGDQAYIDAGYYLTGANQHVQPEQANLPWDYLLWGQTFENEALDAPGTRLVAAPSGSVYSKDAQALADQRRDLGTTRDPYPTVPIFGHESRIAWLSPETLKGAGFFFADDLASMGPVADRMIQIARHKAIFRAARPDGRWDFNLSESAWGARSTYVEHSHVIPEFYYALSGPTIYGVDGERHRVMPGDILFNNSYSPHLIQGIQDGLVFDCFSSTFAPNGDRSVFDRPYFLVEPLPEQPPSARLAEDVGFH